jgi:hypothetical protein
MIEKQATKVVRRASFSASSAQLQADSSLEDDCPFRIANFCHSNPIDF